MNYAKISIEEYNNLKQLADIAHDLNEENKALRDTLAATRAELLNKLLSNQFWSLSSLKDAETAIREWPERVMPLIADGYSLSEIKKVLTALISRAQPAQEADHE